MSGVSSPHQFKCKGCNKKMQFSLKNDSHYCPTCRRKRKKMGSIYFEAKPLPWEKSVWR
jgi:hypothetical protein